MKKLSFHRLLEVALLMAFVGFGAMIVRQGFPAPRPELNEELTEAKYWLSLEGNAVQCRLCFRSCTIAEGARGYCEVRENRGGTLYTLVYGKPCALTPGSPMEKLPLYHVKPGSLRFNVATAGCNFKCSFCHNWHIAVRPPEEVTYQRLSPEEVAAKAAEHGLEFIAFTYNEPTVFYEYMYDISVAAKQRGIRTLLNTNGAIKPEPLRALLEYIDAVNVDLKAFTAEFYDITSLAELQPVLDTLQLLAEEEVWFEIVNLVIPTLNDDTEIIRQMCRWIREELGDEVPVHFNRFFPAYKLTRVPPTPVETLEDARRIALEEGLKYVYIGNVPGHPANNTYCPGCNEKVVGRTGFAVTELNVEEAKCRFCGRHLPGVWN